MSQRLSRQVKVHLLKAKSAAISAMDGYNRQIAEFKTAQYIVTLSIAWTALFHAIFFKRGINPWYRKDNGIHYKRIDGEPKYWDLSECIRNYYGGNNPPEKANLEFIIKLRNRIEHRDLPELDYSLFGECYASILNFNNLLIDEFGEDHALEACLAISIQYINMKDYTAAQNILLKESTRSIANFIESYRGNLSPEVLNSIKYSFAVYLVPKVIGREKASDVAIQFIKYDEASEEELENLSELNVLIRDKHVPIAHLGHHKPSQVVDKVKNRLPFSFNMHHHTQAWKYFKVRPKSGDSMPERTLSNYCIYDFAHRDYLYTDAWVEKLAKQLIEEEKFLEITGVKPRSN